MFKTHARDSGRHMSDSIALLFDPHKVTTLSLGVESQDNLSGLKLPHHRRYLFIQAKFLVPVVCAFTGDKLFDHATQGVSQTIQCKEFP
jgi:hypothetical protein